MKRAALPMLSTMRSGAFLLGLFLTLSATAAAAPPDRTLVLDQPVAQISSSAPTRSVHHVAFLTAGRCPTVGVWRLTGPPQTLGPRACTSRPFGLTLRGDMQWATVRTANARRVYAVWRSEMGFQSNRDPYSQPKAVVRATVAQGERAPIVMYDGLFWANGQLPGLQAAFAVPPLRAALGGNSIAVEGTSGEIEFYLGGDEALGRIQYPRGAVKALKGDSKSSQFAVLRRGWLDVVTSRGEVRHTMELPPAASYGDDRCYRLRCTTSELRLADFEWPYALYVRGQSIHIVDIRSGKDLVVRRPAAGPVHAQMEVTGLTYSDGSRISYLGRFKIDALFRR